MCFYILRININMRCVIFSWQVSHPFACRKPSCPKCCSKFPQATKPQDTMGSKPGTATSPSVTPPNPRGDYHGINIGPDSSSTHILILQAFPTFPREVVKFINVILMVDYSGDSSANTETTLLHRHIKWPPQSIANNGGPKSQAYYESNRSKMFYLQGPP